MKTSVIFKSCKNSFQQLKHILIIVLLIITNPSIYAQIFEETFDEAENSVSGVDNIGGVNWTSTCPNSVAATDYLKVVGGKLEGRDTNGDALFRTGNIDISSANYIQIEVEVSESGTMEPCGSGCNSVDWVGLSYALDGGADQYPSNSFACSGTCGGQAIYADDLSGTQSYTTNCISTGGASNLTIDMLVSCWAGSEYWRIDNIRVFAYSDISCSIALPVVLYDFNGKHINHANEITWSTSSEKNTNYFVLERSFNGESFEHVNTTNGSGNSVELTNYEYLDYDLRGKGVYYYRLTSFDFDGSQHDYGIRAVHVDAENSLSYNYSNHLIIGAETTTTLSVYSLDGRLVEYINDNQLYFNKRGAYIVIDHTTGDKLKIVLQ